MLESLLTIPLVAILAVTPIAAEAGTAAVHRQDLARSYLHLEQALDQVVLEPDRRATTNRGVDALTMLFFSGKLAAAVEQLDGITADVLGLREDQRAAWLGLAAQRCEVEPLVTLAGATPEVAIAMRSLVPGRELPQDTSIVITGPDGESITHAIAPRLRLHAGEAAIVGRYEISLRSRALELAVPIGHAFVCAAPPETTAAALNARLQALTEAPQLPTRPQDRSAMRSRIGLLTSTPSTSRSAEFLANPAALEVELGREMALLEAGQSPWVGRTGDAWRTISAMSVEVPVRQFVPTGIAAEQRIPLIIALHGAGGDENMFFTGYGNGFLKRLAQTHGCAVVCPSTTLFLSSPVVFDALVDEMAACAPIDRSRIFVIGHSMGAVATGSIASSRGAAIAGIAMMAGFGGVMSEGSPPAYVAAGGLDPIFRIDAVRTGVEASRGRGAAMELIELPQEGHTLLVSAALPAAVDWLLALPRRSQATAAPR